MSSREELQHHYPEGARVQSPHGPGTIAWASAATHSLGQGSQSIPVLLDRPPAGLFGGALRFYYGHELQPLLV